MNVKMIETIFKVLKLPHYVENEENLKYLTPDSICFDICAAIAAPIILKPGERAVVPTGVKFVPEYPIWYRINSRSGMAAKNGVISVGGIIDTDYRGEVKVILVNTNSAFNGAENDYTVLPGARIAQIEVPFPYKVKFEEVDEEEFNSYQTVRGAGGFGSSGM